MKRYKWEPEARNAGIGHGPNRSLDGKPGDVVELDPAHAEKVNAIVPGANGKPALIEVKPRRRSKAKPADDAPES